METNMKTNMHPSAFSSSSSAHVAPTSSTLLHRFLRGGAVSVGLSMGLFSSAAVITALTVVTTATGCAPKLIPGSKIEDTPENVSVVRFLKEYRDAVSSRSSQKVLALVAKDFFERNGSVDQADDYGYDQLKASLDEQYSKAKEIQLDIMPERVERDDKLVYVYYRFHQRFLLSMPSGERWESMQDVGRLVLRMRGETPDDGYLIVAGL